MTEEQAFQFVDEVLRGLWTGWEPTNAELQLWTKNLVKVLYEPTRQNIYNWFAMQQRPGKRPLIGTLKHLFVHDKAMTSEPVPVFELIEDKGDGVLADKGMSFFAPSGLKIPENRAAIEEYAENVRRNCEHLYRKRYVIKWKV